METNESTAVNSIDQDPPEVGIALGSNINGDDVKEGDDLYIECHIRANPSFHKLQWTHNVSPKTVFSLFYPSLMYTRNPSGLPQTLLFHLAQLVFLNILSPEFLFFFWPGFLF